MGDQDLDGEPGAASRSLLSNEETGKLAVRGERGQPAAVLCVPLSADYY